MKKVIYVKKRKPVRFDIISESCALRNKVVGHVKTEEEARVLMFLLEDKYDDLQVRPIFIN